jgi:ABC-type uncharacterized transport system ATPase subunit
MLHLVEELCGRILIVARGRKLVEGTLDEIRAATAGLAADQGLEEIFLRAVGDGGGAEPGT